MTSPVNIFMLLPGWEVCIGKNCDRALENAFSSPRSQFFPIPAVRPASKIFIDLVLIAVNWLTSGFVYVTLPLNRLTRRLQTIRKKSNERVSEILYEERCIKEQIYFKLLYVSAFSSTVKVSKLVFLV